MKLEKWAARALKGVLVGYDGHTIYRVYIKSQKKVILVKNFCIFEDYETKATTELSDYNEGTPTLQGFLFEDNDEEETGLLSPYESRKVKNTEGKQPAHIAHKVRKVNDAEPKPITRTGRKVNNAEPKTNARAEQKVIDAEFFSEPIAATCAGSRADDNELFEW